MGSLVNDVKYRTASRVYDINYNIIVKLDIILPCERKSSRGLFIFLKVMIILGKIFECEKFHIMTKSIKKYV